jgi:hypothetical protein
MKSMNNNGLNHVVPKYQTNRMKVVRQLKSFDTSRLGAAKLQASIEKVGQTVMGSNLFFSVILSTSLQSLWGAINVLHIALLLGMI